MQDLINEAGALRKKLDASVSAMRQYGGKYAQTEHDYKIALAKGVLAERDKGTPVTIISLICYGKPEIARLRLERDNAEVVYKAAQEAIQSYKLQLRLIDAQIDREWNSGGRT